VTEEHGKVLPAALERFILLVELSGGSGSGGVMEQQRLPNITYRILLQFKALWVPQKIPILPKSLSNNQVVTTHQLPKTPIFRGSLMNVDVTCYLAIYGIDCMCYKTSLDLSG
jgi:hypothetical protein